MPIMMQEVVALGRAMSGPTVNTIITSFAALTMVFILAELVKMRDKVRSIWTAIYGEQGTNIESGLLFDVKGAKDAVESLNDTFSDHVNKEQAWQKELAGNISRANQGHQETLTNIDTRLEAVEVQVAVNIKLLDTLSHGRRGKSRDSL